jgi:hypothetical protein
MVIIGVKYYNAFHIDNLLLQLEYNHVRPYVYSHSVPIIMDIIIKVSDINGAVISKLFIARYHKGRYFADAKLLQVLALGF